MEKLINIGDKEVRICANAFTPIKYSNEYQRDLFSDLTKISDKNPDITTISRLAYTMALQADSTIGTMEDWLSQFDLMDFYQALPNILELWANNSKQNSRPKKAQGK